MEQSSNETSMSIFKSDTKTRDFLRKVSESPYFSEILRLEAENAIFQGPEEFFGSEKRNFTTKFFLKFGNFILILYHDSEGKKYSRIDFSNPEKLKISVDLMNNEPSEVDFNRLSRIEWLLCFLTDFLPPDNKYTLKYKDEIPKIDRIKERIFAFREIKKCLAE